MRSIPPEFLTRLVGAGALAALIGGPALAQAPLCDDRLNLIGGCTLPIAKFPWQVSIGLRDASAYDGHFCGGSLIDRRWVLTAAHCIVGDASQDIVVHWGSADLESGARSVGVRRFFIPAEAFGPGPRRDLALIELERDVPLRTARIARPGADDRLLAVGGQAVITGWGLTEQSKDALGTDAPSLATSRMLRGAELPIVDLSLCEIADEPGVICAGFPALVADACRGDSGGPLLARDGAEYIQIGVVRSGELCSSEGEHYGSYTAIAAYRDWIDAVLQGFVAPSTRRADEPLLIDIDVEVDGHYGAVVLEPGFRPSPSATELQAGGEFQAGWIAAGCVGAVADKPDLQVFYSGAGGDGLNMLVDGEADTTLLVRAPDGAWHCADDISDEDRRPRLSWPSPQPGRYSVFVGTFSSGAFPEVELRIWEGAPE